MSGDRVAVFARAPIPGRTKTRLAAAIGAEPAAALSRAFLADTLAAIERARLSAIVWAASDDDAVHLRAELDREVLVQPGGALGARIGAAIEAGAALVVGSDAPTLPHRLLSLARAALDGADAVLGPTADGGYWVFGARRPAELASIRWSTPHALADTRAALADRRVALVPPWYDVDTADDLRLLRLHLAVRPSAAPATARLLTDKGAPR